MHNYLIDRPVLERFVDELIKQKTLPVSSVEELQNFREVAIQKLDDEITTAIFGQFTNATNAKFNELLDNPNTTEEDYDNFFAAAGIDVDDTTLTAMNQFADRFPEGVENV